MNTFQTDKKVTQMKSLVETRRYFMMDINGEDQLCVNVDGEWTQDATCVSINQMLRDGLVCKTSVVGWVERRYKQKTKFVSQ